MNNDDELKSVLEQLSNENETQENNEVEEGKRVNADFLSHIANIDIILSIIGAVGLLINSFSDEVNWIGIVSAIIMLISGITLFFLLKTVVDIYRKVAK